MNEEIPYTISLIHSIIQYYYSFNNSFEKFMESFLFSACDNTIYNFKN